MHHLVVDRNAGRRGERHLPRNPLEQGDGVVRGDAVLNGLIDLTGRYPRFHAAGGLLVSFPQHQAGPAHQFNFIRIFQRHRLSSFIKILQKQSINTRDGK